MTRSIVLVALCLPLAACSSLKGTFENRITTTLTGDRAFFTSLYGPVGITAELSSEDARELQRIAEQSRAYEQIVRAFQGQKAAPTERKTP